MHYVCTTQIRNKWTDWRMAKDVRKRITQAQYAPEKLRINAMRKTDFLPREITEEADVLINQLPRDAIGRKIQQRCSITSRPRGNVLRWRVSRIVFRSLADYNKLAGVQRAMW
ncbi:unnamed protein product [Nesidiocoris tenuis]|uniref:Ribosomal protein S14 n=1 Tax=Nesidiocoris tenuis TaxID=355587 RepID=A0A6H5FV17_9HEMI|nr:unnamed protein product [Nesidiocoris tenuis]